MRILFLLLVASPLFPFMPHMQHSLSQRGTEDVTYYLSKEAHDGRVKSIPLSHALSFNTLLLYLALQCIVNVLKIYGMAARKE
jgi:hypothetical protein